MIIQYLLIFLIALAFSRTLLRAKSRSISAREFFFWTIVWGLAALVVAWPESVNRIADILGVGRGADVVVYVGLLFVFYLLFRVFLRIETLERLITKLIRQEALKDDTDVS